MTNAQHRRGVSLVELLVAMAMSATVLGGAVAAIGLSGRTFQSAANGIRSSDTVDALGQMSSDVQLALKITERTSTAMTFWVPDRTGDGAPEQIRYAWGGTDGDPITYSMNGSTPVDIVPDANTFLLEYVSTTMTGQPTFVSPAAPAPNDEIIFERASTDSGESHTLTVALAVAAIIQPKLPTGGTTFRVTKVQIPMIGNAGGGDVMVSLHRVNMVSGVPQATILVSDSLRQADMPATMTAMEFDMTAAVDFSAGDYIAVVVTQDVGLSAGLVALEPSPRYLTDGWIAVTGLLGVWGVNATKDMPIVVYGEVNPGS